MDVGVIGVGAMGKDQARVYSELKAVENLYLFDLDTKAARELAKKFDANIASGMVDLLDSVDAVSVCVPTQFHHKVACEVIQKNIPVLIEKPICLSSGEAADLVEKIPEDLIVGVGHIERFNAIIAELASIIRHPLYVEVCRHNPASSRVTGSSVVEDLMIHDIDLIFHLIKAKSWEVRSWVTVMLQAPFLPSIIILFTYRQAGKHRKKLGQSISRRNSLPLRGIS